MEFNIDKCQSMTISRKTISNYFNHALHNKNLGQVNKVKYLGIQITSNLKWDEHIEAACSRAKGVLWFLSRNPRISSSKTKELAYFSLVRPHVEYCSTIWDPYTAKNINKIEMVQRRGARFVTDHYQYTYSVSSMLNELGWRSLENRRRDARLAMFYKIQNSLVSINLMIICILQIYFYDIPITCHFKFHFPLLMLINFHLYRRQFVNGIHYLHKLLICHP